MLMKTFNKRVEIKQLSLQNVTADNTLSIIYHSNLYILLLILFLLLFKSNIYLLLLVLFLSFYY